MYIFVYRYGTNPQPVRAYLSRLGFSCLDFSPESSASLLPEESNQTIFFGLKNPYELYLLRKNYKTDLVYLSMSEYDRYIGLCEDNYIQFKSFIETDKIDDLHGMNVIINESNFTLNLSTQWKSIQQELDKILFKTRK